jgi:hypothetical protein
VAERVAAGTWVELHDVVLPAGQRAPQVPPETQRVPLELLVRGWLVEPAALGEVATIRTPARRQVRGRLVAVEPGHHHSFGPPVPALGTVGDELRRLLAAEVAP